MNYLDLIRTINIILLPAVFVFGLLGLRIAFVSFRNSDRQNKIIASYLLLISTLYFLLAISGILIYGLSIILGFATSSLNEVKATITLVTDLIIIYTSILLHRINGRK